MKGYNTPMQTELETQRLLKLADACVVCGLCVPHCPTYNKTGLEADSPRGRIQLMRAVLREELTPSPRFHEHIDACLTCRTCEAVCPNHVSYGLLVDGIRSRYPSAKRKPRWFDRPLSFLAQNPSLWSLLRYPAAIAQNIGFGSILKKNGLASLPLSAPFKDHYAAIGEQIGKVSLFLGCVSRLSEVPVISASIQLLQQAGYAVDIPKDQGCCGALALHQGERSKALAQININQKAFGSHQTIVFSATGCGATLMDYPSYTEGAAFPAQDVLTLLASSTRLRFKALKQSVWIQTPCSQRNVVKSVSHAESLLQQIPELDIQYLSGNQQCCGAAGRYHLDQPQMAEQLRADKIAAIQQQQATLILSSNVGCALWLRAALPANTKLIHPLELLAQQLET